LRLFCHTSQKKKGQPKRIKRSAKLLKGPSS
jgi:hypothetical protein